MSTASLCRDIVNNWISSSYWWYFALNCFILRLRRIKVSLLLRKATYFITGPAYILLNHNIRYKASFRYLWIPGNNWCTLQFLLYNQRQPIDLAGISYKLTLSQRSQISFMPSATGIRSFMLNFWPDMLTSGVTSHPIRKEDVIYFINMRMGQRHIWLDLRLFLFLDLDIFPPFHFN